MAFPCLLVSEHCDMASNEHDGGLQQRDSKGNTQLYRAAASGSTHEVERLLQTGAHVNAKNKKKWTPLHAAAMAGNVSIIRILAQNGADKDRENVRRMTPLMIACKFGEEEAMCELLELGCDARSGQDMFGRTVLHWAVKGGTLEMARSLHSRGSDTNEQDRFGKTPVIQSVKSNKLSILRYFLQQNVDLCCEERYCRPALHLAASKERVACLEVLLEHGLSPDARNSQGKTSLMFAAENCNPACVSALLDAGADPNAMNPLGLNALLMLALSSVRPCRSRRALVEIALMLLKANADLDVKCRNTLSWRATEQDVHSAFEIVSKAGNIGLVKLLARAGSDAGDLRNFFRVKTLDLPVYFKKNTYILDWIRRFYASPLSLKGLSRKAFRKSVPGIYNQTVKKMPPMAPGIVDYLEYSDMVDLLGEYGMTREENEMDQELEDTDSEVEYEPSVFDSDNYSGLTDIVDSE